MDDEDDIDFELVLDVGDYLFLVSYLPVTCK